jgi:peptide-N4-(N-acetyl-beta-glucosaminyl)asparagine amidase
MEDRQQPGRPRTLDDEFDFNAADLTQQFEQLLRNRRLNDLEEQARSSRAASPRLAPRSSSHASPSPFPNTPNSASSPRPFTTGQQPPTYNLYRSHPIIPVQPQDASSYKFRNFLLTISVTPTKYENPGLLDEALTHVPIDRINAEAEEEHNIMKGIAASMGEGAKPEWGYQDCVIKSLLRCVN